jgi:hypothetical protein
MRTTCSRSGDEDLSVADLAGVGGLLDRLDDAIEEIVPDRRSDLDLRQEIDDVLRAAIELGVALSGDRIP